MKCEESNAKEPRRIENTPPQGVPTQCCDAVQRLWITVYGDTMTFTPGMIEIVRNLESKANRIEAQGEIISKSIKYFGLNNFKGLIYLIGLIILFIAFFWDKIKIAL